MKAVSGKEMGRILERNGWVLARRRGSHHRYEKQGFAPLTIRVIECLLVAESPSG